jgi:hypothetical protein
MDCLSRRRERTLTALFLIAVLHSHAAAQGANVRIIGRVIDEQGLPIPGATVTAIGERASQALTDIEGRYEFNDLRAGTYAVTAELVGFRPARRTVRARTASVSVADLTMRFSGCRTLGVTYGFVGPSLPPPYVASQIPERSDIVADLVIVGQSVEKAARRSECRRAYTAWVLRTLSRNGFHGTVSRRINLLLTTSVEPGGEYVVWLTWRASKNAFESDEPFEGVMRRVENGMVRARDETYSLDDLFKAFENMRWRTAR